MQENSKPLHPDDPTDDPDSQRLRDAVRPFAPPQERYVRGEVIGSGGMAVVKRASDQLVSRDVALKILRTSGGAPEEQKRRLRRFLSEARITGQLDHPAIVPVHDIGFDTDGTPYFAMKRVRGEPLSQSIERMQAGEEAWTLTRLVGALLKVCEAMSYAHQKRVLHRDLKPSNVMVGRFGEVYVMDWGLARRMEEPEQFDIRVRAPAPAPDPSSVAIKPLPEDDELRTEDGDIVGTPAYMPPEQAHGRIEEMGPRSDIYSLGAMLYHVLAGHMPYVPAFSRAAAHTIFLWVREGPPADLATIAPDAPPELVAVCSKAMARDPARRFASMDEVADELRRYLEGRVVVSHRTGPVIELRKWAARNRFAAALAIATPLLLLGAAGMTVEARDRSLQEERFRNDVLSARELVATARSLGPLEPQSAPAMRAWLFNADELLAREELYLREFEALTHPAEPSLPAAHELTPTWNVQRTATLSGAFTKGIGDTQEKLAKGPAEQERAFLEELLRVWEVEESDWQRAYSQMLPRKELATRRPTHEGVRERAEQLGQLLASLHRLRSVVRAQVQDDLARAESIRSRSIESERDRWESCARSVSDARECPHYAGMPALAPQLGLVPLGLNQRTGLWEFWHVESGERPECDEAGEWRVGERGGLVLVLLPGGRFRAGLESGPEPVSSWSIELAPFFVSKYELTQGQFLRLTGRNPSEHFAGMHHGKRSESAASIPVVTRAHPAENMTWVEALEALQRVELGQITEAQWEYAARAGAPGLHGDASPDHLTRFANIADLDYADAGQARPGAVVQARDGFALHAPVGSLAPNGFGLYDMLGNVAEWCCDVYVRPREQRTITVLDGTGERSTTWRLHRTYKGGAFKHTSEWAQIPARLSRDPDARDDYIGIRAARAVRP